MTDKSWSPEDLFKPSKEYPQGSSGEWMAEENGVMVRKIYNDGKLVATEVGAADMKFYIEFTLETESLRQQLAAANTLINKYREETTSLRQQLAEAQAQSARMLQIMSICNEALAATQLKEQGK